MLPLTLSRQPSLPLNFKVRVGLKGRQKSPQRSKAESCTIFVNGPLEMSWKVAVFLTDRVLLFCQSDWADSVLSAINANVELKPQFTGHPWPP
jgi:hypothetical protein